MSRITRDALGYTESGDVKMKTNKEILSSLLKTTQMGQIGVRTVEKYATDPALQKALGDQRREYDAIETQAHEIATQRGWQVKELNPAIRYMSEIMTRMQLMGSDVDSKIAAMMVTGNTRGLIKGLKNDHRYENRDSRINALAQKLMDTENANIRQMEPFL